MSEITILRIGAENFADFAALIAPCQNDEGCDLFPSPSSEALASFLQSQPEEAFLKPMDAPVALHDAAGNPIGWRQVYASDADTPGIVIEEAAGGGVYVQMAAPEDASSFQYAIIQQQAGLPPVITHAFAMPAEDYVAALHAHPPIDGQPVITAERWADGTITLTRQFIENGKAFALPLYTLLPHGVPETVCVKAGRMPEDAYRGEAIEATHYHAALSQKHGGLKERLSPVCAEISNALAQAAGRPTLIKYAEADKASSMLGKLWPKAAFLSRWLHAKLAATAQSQPSAHVIEIPAAALPRILNILSHDIQAEPTQAALRQIAREWPGHWLDETMPSDFLARRADAGFHVFSDKLPDFPSDMPAVCRLILLPYAGGFAVALFMATADGGTPIYQSFPAGIISAGDSQDQQQPAFKVEGRHAL